MNIQIVKPQPGPQAAFIQCTADVVCYGGARGGGKSWAIALDFWLHAERHGEDARGLILRKTREDLKDFIDTAGHMYAGSARYSEKGNFFRFTSGAKLYCGYLEREADAANYQGWSLTRLYFDELTQLTTLDPVLRLLATLRSAKGIRPQAKFSCNPGGPSHHEVKSKFVDLGAYNVTWKDGLSWVFIPARVQDNPALLQADPRYIDRLKSTGSPQRVRAWLEGDWNVIEGAFFSEFMARHVITPFTVPAHWTKFRSMDWGSASPFAVHWLAVVQDNFEHDGCTIPRGALLVYREWYGASAPNVGLKLTAEEVAAGIVSRETSKDGRREDIAYGVLDPSAFAVQSGPSIAETLMRHGAVFRRADNTRTSAISHDRRKGGWDQLRARLKGDGDGRPLIYFFSTCRDIIRTLPLLQHDPHNAEDVDTDGDDHAADSIRYACLSRPYLAHEPFEDETSRSPYLVANAFRFSELRD
ncbi:MAG: terminase family protein [Pseudolabrys sp.]